MPSSDIEHILNSLDPSVRENIQSWLTGDFSEEEKREIIEKLRENPDSLIDPFGKQLAFGTGGLRSVVGIGTNRMNAFNVMKASQALANYLKKSAKKLSWEGTRGSILIGFDSRIHSKEFAHEAAKVFLSNGFDVYVFNNPRPVALVSFGVRSRGCLAGVMITASHNPPEYNGYKVYMHTGGQVIPPMDSAIIKEYKALSGSGDIFSGEAVDGIRGRLITIHDEIDHEYLDVVEGLQLYPENNTNEGEQLNIVYSNLHGAGIPMVPFLLDRWGFTQISLVEEQIPLDGRFPTVKVPNPESREALTLGLSQMLREGADLFMATDPDADRLGVACLWNDEPYVLSGNEIACLLADHVLGQGKISIQGLRMGKSLDHSCKLVKSLVTTEMLSEIAKKYGVELVNVLTGFKYIGEKIDLWEKSGEHFIFGAEESYGYLYGIHVRDKDALVSSALIAELALKEKLEGRTLFETLLLLYEKYGYYVNKTFSLDFPGVQGELEMKEALDHLRENGSSLEYLGGQKIARFEDYLSQEGLNVLSGKRYPLTVGKSNIILFSFLNGSRVIFRPSGTEPKMKVYVEVIVKYQKQTQDIEEQLIRKHGAEEELQQFLLSLKKDLGFL